MADMYVKYFVWFHGILGPMQKRLGDPKSWHQMTIISQKVATQSNKIQFGNSNDQIEHIDIFQIHFQEEM